MEESYHAVNAYIELFDESNLIGVQEVYREDWSITDKYNFFNLYL